MGNDTVSLTIDGRTITAEKGRSLLEVARENGIDIPSLCRTERLAPTGSCRLCIVEVKGLKGLKSACTLTAEEGLVVTAFSEEIERTRKTILELILSDHDYDCSICHQNGECALQDLGYRYQIGVNTNRKLDMVTDPPSPVKDTTSPVLNYTSEKCINCGRCVQACRDLQGKYVLSFVERGIEAYPSPEYRNWADSACDGCGECVQVCPTGALTEKPLAGRHRKMDTDRIVRSTCAYCGVGCQMDLWIKDNRIVRIRGAETEPNRGRLCVKGRFGYEYAASGDRLTTPLIRKDGVFRKATWKEALTLTAARLGEIRDSAGASALAGLSSARCTNEDNYVFQKFVRGILGTNSVDHCARLCHAPTVAGLVRSFGSGAMTNSIPELAGADCILITGSNVSETHPVTATYIRNARDRGAKVIVVDPRKIDLTRRAFLWLRQKPGTDVAWINGLLHVIITEGLADEGFIRSRTENFDQMKETVMAYTPERVEEISGIPADKLRLAARTYASAEKSSIVFAMGITQHVTGTDNVLSLANLAMAAGQIGRESTGVNPLRGQNNVQGACDLGALPNVYPGYQKVEDPRLRENFEVAWGLEKLPDKPGLTVVEIMNAAAEGVVKGLYIMGENPMMSDPDIGHVEEALKNLDFLVVQDIFLTETARLADVVLPAAAAVEKDGTFTNSGRRILRVRPAVPPPGDAMEDWRILSALAGRMGYCMTWEDAEEIMKEIASLTPLYGGISYKRLENEDLQWPCLSKEHGGTRYLHRDRFAKGTGTFHPVDYIPPAELTDREYPFILSTGRMLYHYHTATMSRRSGPLNAYAPGAYAEISPEDLKALKLGDGDLLQVTTRRGTIRLPARESERVAPGVVFIPFHFSEAPANRLTNPALDPVSRIPELKVAACRIEGAHEP